MPEDHLAPAGRSPIFHDRLQGEAGQVGGMFLRVLDGGGREGERGISAVEVSYPAQPAQDVGHMAAKDAPVGVGFIHDHPTQVEEEIPPRLMVGKDAHMEHVWIGEQDPAAVTGQAPGFRGSVTVIDGRPDLIPGERLQVTYLVLGQGFGGIQVEGATHGLMQEGVQYRKVEGQTLARGGAGCDDEPASVPGRFPAKALMCPKGISRLWTHQRLCWEAAGNGSGFIVTTSTASGKSLAFNLPVLDTLLHEPMSRALYLYPTKALAQDQIRHLEPLAGDEVRPAIYDGDTPPEARRLARDRSRILLTNPDMLHVGILPHHELWGDFFLNLRWVVVDEAHTYRGVFGSHVANVLRRLRRVADFYGADPSFALTSATIHNPEEHAANLTGLALQPIMEDGAPSGRRKVILWQSPLMDERLNLRRSTTPEAALLLAHLVENGARVICFTKSRRQAELIYQAATAELEDRGSPSADRLSPYRAGYTPEQRRDIENRLFQG